MGGGRTVHSCEALLNMLKNIDKNNFEYPSAGGIGTVAKMETDRSDMILWHYCLTLPDALRKTS